MLTYMIKMYNSEHADTKGRNTINFITTDRDSICIYSCNLNDDFSFDVLNMETCGHSMKEERNEMFYLPILHAFLLWLYGTGYIFKYHR